MKITYNDFNIDDLTKIILSWSWQEILFGLDNGLITDIDATEYAKTILSEDVPGFDHVMDLSIAESNEDVQPMIECLVDLENSQSEEMIKRKWLYAILLHIYNKRDQYADPLELVEIIYADFDYPDEIEGFVRYMPISDLGYGVNGTAEEYLYDNWNKYLKSNEDIIGK